MSTLNLPSLPVIQILKGKREYQENNMKSFKVYAKTSGGDGGYNGQRFATQKEADAAGKELHTRWMAMTGWAVEESEDEVNYKFDFDQGRCVAL